MKKVIAQLSGAYKNAGDFLIEKRSNDLLKSVCPDFEVKIYLRNEIEKYYSEINSADAIVFTGGPIYKQDIASCLPYDACMSFVPPMMILGGGWKGINGSTEQTYNHGFNRRSILFYEKVSKEGFGLGCRDLHTVRTLEKSGLQNIHMTGCPAWYNLPTIADSSLHSGKVIERIVISDPVNPEYFDQAYRLTTALRGKYPKAHISFLFHRDVDENFKRSLSTISNIQIKDISGSFEGFHEYDDCDLHVGYRVHAHIYNLSLRNRSILIEEDGRGAGVNEALGLPQIRAYADKINSHQTMPFSFFSKSKPVEENNLHAIDELISWLNIYNEIDDEYLLNAFRLQQQYYRKMIQFIGQLAK